jgi:hypothetical protein
MKFQLFGSVGQFTTKQPPRSGSSRSNCLVPGYQGRFLITVRAGLRNAKANRVRLGPRLLVAAQVAVAKIGQPGPVSAKLAGYDN